MMNAAANYLFGWWVSDREEAAAKAETVRRDAIAEQYRRRFVEPSIATPHT